MSVSDENPKINLETYYWFYHWARKVYSGNPYHNYYMERSSKTPTMFYINILDNLQYGETVLKWLKEQKITANK